MADGSDAIADWPILNALLNTSSGATWVAVHHGGGPGSASRYTPARNSSSTEPPTPRTRAELMLTNDPGTGVMRHADAGYDSARQVRPRPRHSSADARRLNDAVTSDA